METDIDALIDSSDVIVVGNAYPGVATRIREAADRKRVVDLTRIDPGLVSGDGYQGICW